MARLNEDPAKDHLGVPYAALVFWCIPNQQTNMKMVELCTIRNGNLVDPHVLEETAIQELIAGLQQMSAQNAPTSFYGWVPSPVHAKYQMLYLAPFKIMFLHASGEQELILGKNKQKVWLPPMMFLYSGPDHKLNAYFSMRDVILEPFYKEKCLMPAALPNVNNYAGVCLGDSMQNIVFEPDITKMPDLITGAFFRSTFTEWHDKKAMTMFKMLSELKNDSDRMEYWKNYAPKNFDRWVSPESLVKQA